jgi:hypothetical protein
VTKGMESMQENAARERVKGTTSFKRLQLQGHAKAILQELQVDTEGASTLDAAIGMLGMRIVHLQNHKAVLAAEVAKINARCPSSDTQGSDTWLAADGHDIFCQHAQLQLVKSFTHAEDARTLLKQRLLEVEQRETQEGATKESLLAASEEVKLQEVDLEGQKHALEVQKALLCDEEDCHTQV